MKKLNKDIALEWLITYWSASLKDSHPGVFEGVETLDEFFEVASKIWKGYLKTSMMYTCDECGTQGYDMVLLGEEEEQDSRTVTVCAACLQKANELIEG